MNCLLYILPLIKVYSDSVVVLFQERNLSYRGALTCTCIFRKCANMFTITSSIFRCPIIVKCLSLRLRATKIIDKNMKRYFMHVCCSIHQPIPVYIWNFMSLIDACFFYIYMYIFSAVTYKYTDPHFIGLQNLEHYRNKVVFFCNRPNYVKNAVV